MSWRDTLGVTALKTELYAQNTHNTQKPPQAPISAYSANNAYRGADSNAPASTPDADNGADTRLVGQVEGLSVDAAVCEDLTERAAIIEFDGNETRGNAEQRAVQLVQCRACAHFIPDTMNAADGIGRCELHAWPQSTAYDLKRPMPPYPRAERYCKTFQSRDTP